MKDSERQLQLRGERLDELTKMLDWYMQTFGSPEDAMRDRSGLNNALSARELHLAELQAQRAKDADVSSSPRTFRGAQLNTLQSSSEMISDIIARFAPLFHAITFRLGCLPV